VQGVRENPGLQRSPRFRGFHPLLYWLNREPHARLVGKQQALVGLEYTVNDSSHHSGCQKFYPDWMFAQDACRHVKIVTHNSSLAKAGITAMEVKTVDGDLLDQPVDAVVNPWNRNVIPWWLLLPQGVSGAIKKRGGYQLFRELSKAGIIPLGQAVATS